MLQHSDIQSIIAYLNKINRKTITVSQLRTQCGLPKRVKDRDIIRYIKDHYPDYTISG